MGELKYEEHRRIRKPAELEELWVINAEQEACITSMDDHHTRLQELHEHTWNDYKVRELELEIT